MEHDDDPLPGEVLRHGAYFCLRVPGGARRDAAAAPVAALAARRGFCNEFDAGAGHRSETIAFLRRVDATPGGIDDGGLVHADAVVHVAAPTSDPIAQLRAELTRLLGPAIQTRVLTGVVRPPAFTGHAMHEFAYAHQVAQAPGTEMPHGFLMPMSKSATWWAKGWMERHTYFLPRYDDDGRMLSEGHALAAAPGIDCLMRRTYKHPLPPAPDGAYDFVNYFECADDDVPTFQAVCAALRDIAKNPEWRFVREGPTWHGRRVETWAELFA